jgi:hypothetical protein
MENASCKLCGSIAQRTFERLVWSTLDHSVGTGRLEHVKDLYRFECPQCGLYFNFQPVLSVDSNRQLTEHANVSPDGRD